MRTAKSAGVPAETRAERTGAKKTTGRRAPGSVVLRRWLAVGALLLVALLYYRPIKAYVDAHGQLAQKQTQVRTLQTERTRLKHRLGSSTSLDTLAREARALGYVKPGEHLFIAKGINEWRKRERASYTHK